jgi:hypothetical protein
MKKTLRPLRNSLRSLRLRFHRKGRKELRKGRKVFLFYCYPTTQSVSQIIYYGNGMNANG